MTTSEEPGSRPQVRFAAGLLVCTALASGCVHVQAEEDPVLTATPVVIEQLAAPEDADRALVEFYESLLSQMLEAHQDRDLPRLQSLLAGCAPLALPDWVAPRIEGFTGLAHGLHFELATEQRGRLREVDPAPAGEGVAALSRASIGAPLVYELELPVPDGGPWRLGAVSEPDPVAFQVALVVREHFLDGTQKKIEDADVVRLDHAVELDDEALRLPVRVDLGASEAVRREIELEVRLLPGYVRRGDVRAPVRNTLVATATARQWPPGHEVIRTAPLRTLQNAQRLGDRDHFKHVRLAAEFAGTEERAEVERSLMEWVRLGRPDQSLVAMATLRAIVPDGAPAIGDRDGWLSWWEARR